VPTLLFRLNGVPDDEADEVRGLLRENGIACYETHAGRWGFSVAAIWLRREHGDQAERALALIDTYQRERTARARAAYAELRRSGRHETLLQRLLRHPLEVIAILALIVGLLYLTLMPFIGWR